MGYFSSLLNRYAYVNGNPLSKFDPDGQLGWAIWIPMAVVVYEVWDFYTNFRDFKNCVEMCANAGDSCIEGNTGPIHSCKSMCVIQFWSQPNGPGPWNSSSKK